MTVCQEWDKQDFSLQKRIFGFVAKLAEHAGLVPYPNLKATGFIPTVVFSKSIVNSNSDSERRVHFFMP
jgi:hypothetical protein